MAGSLGDARALFINTNRWNWREMELTPQRDYWTYFLRVIRTDTTRR